MLDDTFKINYKTLPIAVSTEMAVSTIPHNHREFEILLFRSGNAEVSVGSQTYNVQSGDMVFINPFEVHSIRFLPDREKPSRLCICFDTDILIKEKSIADMLGENSRAVNFIKAADAEYPANELYALTEAYNAAEKWSDSEIIARLTLIFVYMMKNSFIQTSANSDENVKFCAAVLGYIQNNFHDDITSSGAAEALGYTQSYFCRAFRRYFRKTFSEYLTMYRIANARIIIENNNISVAELAEKCGFNSYSYFSKCFRRYIGILPSEYKKFNK